MQKLFLFIAALTLNAALWANEITYTATSGLDVNDKTFDLVNNRHIFVLATGEGTIFFNGDVTAINNEAFVDCNALTSMTLPNTITTIGDYAFKNCGALTDISLSNSLTTIGRMAFYYCYLLKSITIPASVNEIGMDAFHSCGTMKTVTFEGTACQYSIASDVFKYVGYNENPVTLILPEDWNYDAAPANNTTAWYSGYFNSNLYSTDEAKDKQAALDALTIIMRDYSESTYLQTLLAEEVAKINSATNRRTLNECKQAAIDKLEFAVNVFANGLSIGLEKGDETGYQRAMNELPTDAQDAAGHAVTITKGEKTITLVNPDKVSFEKRNASAE